MSEASGSGTIVGLLLPLILGAGSVKAEPLTSVYSSADPANCTFISNENGGSLYRCPGPVGRDFMLNIEEHKVFLSFGTDPTQEQIWTQAMPGTHRIGDVIEWVMDGAVPVATIVRYYIDRSAAGLPEEQVLAVTRIDQGTACHVALIDARRNDNANVIAREAASVAAPEGTCRGMEAQTIGIMGVPELVK
ncbi:hypothetical protein [Pukyongiella litopenaei]|uniref:Uncharacterized protein n=1 Tax=Pukyongiella litopenaei TaxID=2605946 RepID=A0A2S0MSD8_9RHOB|nr:hypothetical protein [Pukyongiella litopenaei]AVO38794.2 hypothetical protein C6Y53_14550 [Pukyongiella litopenaei]